MITLNLNGLCSLILEFTHTLPVCLILAALCLLDYKKGTRVLFILLFTLIFNPFLKSIWQIPLVQNGGWAFPSGHMQASCVLYGWIAWEFRCVIWLRFFTLCLLAGIGGSLMYCGFHVLIDVIGGAFFAGLTLAVYQKVLGYSWIKKHFQWMGIMMTPFTLCFIAFYPGQAPILVWISQGGLIALSVLLVLHTYFFSRIKGLRL